jgi:hypothetical protein
MDQSNEQNLNDNENENKNIQSTKNDSLDIFLKNDNEIKQILMEKDNKRNFHDSVLENKNKGMENDNRLSLSDEFFPEFEKGGVKKTCFQRYCGKMEKGALRGSIFSMVTVALGTGCLSLPNTFKTMSIVIAIICLIFAGVNMLMNLYFLALVANKYQIFEYAALLKKIANKWISRLYDYSSIIYLFGALIAYQVIIYRLVSTCVYDFSYSGELSLVDYLKEGQMTKPEFKWPISFGIAILVIFPLSLMKNLSEMRAISLFNIFSIFYIILVSI